VKSPGTRLGGAQCRRSREFPLSEALNISPLFRYSNIPSFQYFLFINALSSTLTGT
jgi:hypothetical protein